MGNMRDIKNARFYIGAVKCDWLDDQGWEDSREFIEVVYNNWRFKYGTFKLHLRPLDDMTEEEKRECDIYTTMGLETAKEKFLYLINKGFDLGLIPEENVKHIKR